jgi:branched-chain amino acid transport system substrate-binding protein
MKTNVRQLLLPAILVIVIALVGVSGLTPSSDVAAQDVPESIVFGNPIALSGVNAAGANLTQIPSFDLWAADVNAAGGIYVEEFDAQIPVEILRVDDTSDIGTSIQLLERLLLEDEVDFILPPWGTASNFAIAPLVTELETPVLGCTVGSLQLVEESDQYPYFFTVLNQPTAQGGALVDLLVELGVESVSIIHHDDLYGIDFADVVVPGLEEAGIEILVNQTYPVNTEDLSQLIREIQEADPQAFLAFSYPAETFLLTGQMLEIGYTPDLLYVGVGSAFPIYPQVIFSPEIVEGIFGPGAWNPAGGGEGAQEYFDRHVEMFEGQAPDYWASPACYSVGQIMQQAIEAAGTLDPSAVRDAIAEGEFNTVLGTVTFENQFNTYYPGQIGQWQGGEFIIVAPEDQRQADPIYPRGGE